ncbi:LOW QUALITY PROTEIN: hypothetical protein OSB04_031305 [Centaurea solstitialis]|uniref:F-box domain-containing protein n=1 Tax=Centaurea solstitialis TaxID=347529 RepID=A0AA38SSS0_9ASTR|nr:LOW QUALITY PROTEIN: hypothetical protein OSB04_031305 [Centaurea solstitialis]
MSGIVSDDLIDEIFVRLPPKSFIRCTSLSKALASRILSSHFLNKQILQSAKRQQIVFYHSLDALLDIRLFILHVERLYGPPVEGYFSLCDEFTIQDKLLTILLGHAMGYFV